MEPKDQTPAAPASSNSRRTEDIALDLLKFVAVTANLGGKAASGSAGFAAPTAAKPEDQVEQMLKLYARCREAVEAPAGSPSSKG